jgi:hypothetical protein
VSTGDPAGNALTEWIAVWLRDCDVVPRNYRIDWRLPILGPIHAWIRRIINSEVRRYLVPALEKQSFLNRKTLEMLDTLLKRQKALSRTNEHLRQEIERLRERLDRDQDAR